MVASVRCYKNPSYFTADLHLRAVQNLRRTLLKMRFTSFLVCSILHIATFVTAALPTAPNVLEITSVTWGGADFTEYTRSKFAAALSAKPSMTSWQYKATLTFFGRDSNPTFNKVGVAVCRRSVKAGNGKFARSDFNSSAGPYPM